MTAGEPFTPDEARLYGGLHLEGDPLYGDYLEAQLHHLRRRLDGLRHSREGADCGTLPQLIAALEKEGGAEMTTVRDIETFLYAWAPRETAESWDNVGLLVGRGDREVRRVLAALDVTPPWRRQQSRGRT